MKPVTTQKQETKKLQKTNVKQNTIDKIEKPAKKMKYTRKLFSEEEEEEEVKNETLDMNIVQELLQEETEETSKPTPQHLVFKGKHIKFDSVAKTEAKKEFPDYLLQVQSITSDPLQKKSQIDSKITEFLQDHFYNRIQRIQSAQKFSQVRNFVAPSLLFASSSKQ